MFDCREKLSTTADQRLKAICLKVNLCCSFKVFLSGPGVNEAVIECKFVNLDQLKSGESRYSAVAVVSGLPMSVKYFTPETKLNF